MLSARPRNGPPARPPLTGSNGYKLAHNRNSKQAAAGGSLLFSSTRYLTIPQARESDSGAYECIASNAQGADLRKLVYVQVRGKL